MADRSQETAGSRRGDAVADCLPAGFDEPGFEVLAARHLFSTRLADAYRQLDLDARAMCLDFLEHYALFPEAAPTETLPSISEKVGLAPQAVYLVRTMLTILCEDGYLEPVGDGWVRRRPISAAESGEGRVDDPALDMLARCRSGLYPFLEGRRRGVEIVFPGERRLWTRLHHESLFFAPYADLAGFVVAEVLAAGGTVLEIGAGTGAGTAAVLRRAAASQIGRYVFTDIGETFLHDAKSAYAGLDCMVFERLDLNDPTEVAARYAGTLDVVFAINALHVARDLERTVSAVAAMLKPGGRLVLGEGGRPDWSKIWRIDLIFGFLEGWWDVAVDPTIRPEPGFLKAEAWIELLRRCGLPHACMLPRSNPGLGGVVVGRRPR